ncbi:MAG: allophanate hydrolase, partial [Hyphomicrobiaceae bacterium]
MVETVVALISGHRSGTISITSTIERVFRRLAETADPAIFISLREQEAIMADARALSQGDRSLALYGVPVAVKDNIDVAGLPTTAACPAFSYMPERDAEAVARLKRAGAIIIGKTNLDQFATGLVGMRSPYGMPRNALRPDLVSGGSSSGSAVAVARGIVPLALGTDTAGSGRVPAALNNIVGLKPSLGLVSTSGVVPACRSLDCVSVFALSVEDAWQALEVIAGHDERDAYSRRFSHGELADVPTGLRLGVPRNEDKLFFGDRIAEAGFAAAENLAVDLGARLIEIDFAPFLETARLLYEGAWVAERMAAVGDFIAAHTDLVHPVTRQIISQGAIKSAVDAFRGLYRLQELRSQAYSAMAGLDALLVPTMPRPVTVSEVTADAIGPNAQLGTYTNFVNLLDLAAIAIPVTLAPDGTAFGVTLLGHAGRDAALASIGMALHARTGLTLGALGTAMPVLPGLAGALRSGEISLAVVGAHMSGMALNHELTTLGARYLETAATGPDYRLFALAGSKPPKPGLLRVSPGAGAAIAVEIWALSAEAFARFVAAIPPPLSIGSIRLGDGRFVKGFLVEAEAVAGARDISSFGSWPAFVAST